MSSLLSDAPALKAAYPPPLGLELPKPPTWGTPVPLYVWRTWKDSNWKRDCASAHIQSRKTLPTWRHIIWTDDECRAFVHAHFPRLICKAYDLCAVGVMRADLWRYLVLFWYGGLYVDMKSTIVRPPRFATTFNGTPRLYASFWDQSQGRTFHAHLFSVGELQQFWIAAEPGSRALWRVVCQIAANILALHRATHDGQAPFIWLPQRDSPKSRIISTTGPIAFTYAVACELDRDPSSVVILDCDCQQAITYIPPVTWDMPSRRSDHYSKHRGSLVDRTP